MADQQRMPVGLRFKEAGKVYYFDAQGFELTTGNYVVVETSHGQEVGRVVIAPDQVIVSEIKESLKPILRIATHEDLEKSAELKKRAAEHLMVAKRLASEANLDMSIVGGDYALDGSQVTFYFTAPDRVDFRSMVRELSSDIGVRVQLLQVGDRDRAKIVDGIGRCGERLCCSSWLGTFPTVSIKMAKEQELSLNPTKLSGACGRLLCCLTYEYEQYRDIKGGLPKVGARISTPTGDAKVNKINVPKETITLWMEEASQVVDMPLDQFRLMYGTAVRPKELTETFEKELFEAEQRSAAPAAAPRPPERPRRDARPPQRDTPPNAEQARPTGPQGAGRRRRRRGGRRRNRGNSGQS
jgi:cell fate regulator YaaT (PSP1 superfamily)